MPRLPPRAALPCALAVLIAGALPAGAACYADYKAKRDAPLRLHYGVIEVPDASCTPAAAATRVVRPRLAAAGWTLLNVLSTFGADGLASRKDSAGAFFLRF